MADLSSITIPDGTTYDLKDSTARANMVHYIEGPSTDTTAGTWTGTDSSITAYYDGLMVVYVPAVIGASTTKLNINGLGAKTCYYSGTSKLTTHFPVGTPINFVYKNNTWTRADYDSNTKTTVRQTLLNTDNTERPLLLSYANNANTTTNVDNLSYRSNKIYANHTTGVITASGFAGNVNGFEIGQPLPSKSVLYLERPWEYIGELTGDTEDGCPSSWGFDGGYTVITNGLLFVVNIGNTGHNTIIEIPIYCLTTSVQTFRSGWYQSATGNYGGGAYVHAWLDNGMPTYKLGYAYLNGSNVTSTTKTKVFYKGYVSEGGTA